MDAFVEGLLREEQSDEDEDDNDDSGDEEDDTKENTLTQLVNDTIATSDEEDEDYEPTEEEIANAKSFAQEAAKQLAKTKQPVEFNADDDEDDLYDESTEDDESLNGNDTLVDFVNNTINSNEDSDDDDFDIDEEEVVSPPKRASKQQKSNENKLGKRNTSAIPTSKITGKNQKKVTADPAKSQVNNSEAKRNGSQNVKSKQSKAPRTPPKSKRTNFVTAPTPSPAPLKNKKTQQNGKKNQTVKSSPNKKENAQSAAAKKAVKTPATTNKLTGLNKACGGIQKKKDTVNKKSILANKAGKVNAEKFAKIQEAATAFMVTQNKGKVTKPKPQLKGNFKKTK